MAKGKVRCGKCKAIFDARANLQELPAAGTDKAATNRAKPTPAVSRQPSSSPEDSNDIDLAATPESRPDQLEEIIFEEPPEAIAQDTGNDTDDVLIIGDETETDSARAADTAKDYSFTDFTDEIEQEQDLDEILADMNRQLSLAMHDDTTRPQASDTPARKQSTGENDELADSIDQLFDELTPEETGPATPSPEQNIESTFLAEVEASYPDAVHAAQQPGEFDIAAEPREAISETTPPHATEQEHIPFRLRDSLHITPPRETRWWMVAGAMLLVLLLIGTLLAQFALFRPLTLISLLPAAQPYVAQLCGRLPCDFNYHEDLQQIQLLSRDVRAHPSQKNALLITATMVNNAAFRQPYPDLQISLFDLSGNVVAQRRFTPADYMGELNSPFLLMSPETPVQVTLEVLDPGNDAINFEFEFR